MPARLAVGRTGRTAEAGDPFRADIEGLRAIAVLLVVLFHAGLGFSGGFVGVDVFFVVSGFLITGLLLRELDTTGSIDLARFYARRVRRLLPAAILVLVVTLLLSLALLPPLLLPGVAGDIGAAAAYVSNLGFALQATDYFAAGQLPSPVLHFWSLGVEEQFYLFWPAFLLVVAAGAAHAVDRPRRIGTAITAVTAISFLLSLWLTGANQPWAFYSLPTRAWELGLGAMLGAAGSRLTRVDRPLATAAGWIGLALILVAGIALNSSTQFPGTAALLPTLGAALVILAGAGVTAAERAPARYLAAPIPRFFGRISYSLYLWHWPLLVIPAAAVGGEVWLPARLALVGLAVVLAWVTNSLLEDPLRHGALIGTRPRPNLALAGGLALIVGTASLTTGAVTSAGLGGGAMAPNPSANAQEVRAILKALASTPPTGSVKSAATRPRATDARAATTAVRSTATARPRPTATPVPRTPVPTASPTASPTPSPTPTALPVAPVAPAAGSPFPALFRPATLDAPVPPDLQPALGNARRDYPASYLDGCHAQLDGNPTKGTCLYGALDSETTIALFGDSHALAMFPAMERFAEEQGWRLLSLTMSTCNPATIPIWVTAWNRVSHECNAWRERAIQELVAAHPALIVVSGTRGFATTDPGGSMILEGDARADAWRMGMAATLARLVPAAGRVIVLADAPLSKVDPPVCLSQHPLSTLACATPVDAAINRDWLALEQRTAASWNAGFVDPERWICPTSPCPVVLGNLLIYRDPGHLTATFSAAISDLLGDALLADLRSIGAAPISDPPAPRPGMPAIADPARAPGG